MIVRAPPVALALLAAALGFASACGTAGPEAPADQRPELTS